MLVVNTKETFLLILHQNRVHFPEERNAFVLDPQHGRRDVTYKPAIASSRQGSLLMSFVLNRAAKVSAAVTSSDKSASVVHSQALSELKFHICRNYMISTKLVHVSSTHGAFKNLGYRRGELGGSEYRNTAKY